MYFVYLDLYVENKSQPVSTNTRVEVIIYYHRYLSIIYNIGNVLYSCHEKLSYGALRLFTHITIGIIIYSCTKPKVIWFS